MRLAVMATTAAQLTVQLNNVIMTHSDGMLLVPGSERPAIVEQTNINIAMGMVIEVGGGDSGLYYPVWYKRDRDRDRGRETH